MVSNKYLKVVSTDQAAVLDQAHVDDIQGAFGSISANNHAPRDTWWSKLKTLLAILGPGLIKK